MEEQLEGARWRGRIEARLDLHIKSEELLLTSILSKLDSIESRVNDIKEGLAVHEERSSNQHNRVAKVEKVALYGGGLFATIFTGLIVALITGAFV